MALDPRIGLLGNQDSPWDAAGAGFDSGLKDAGQIQQQKLNGIDLQNAQRSQAAQGALRGILSDQTLNQNDPAYLQTVQQKMQAAGFGPEGQQYAATVNTNKLANAKTAQDTQGLQLIQDQEVQKTLASQAAAAARAAQAVSDPAAQKAIHDSFVQNVQQLKAAHPGLNLGPYDPDTLSHEDFSDPATLKTISQLDYTPEMRVAALGKEKDEDFKGALPGYQKDYQAALAIPDRFQREAAVAAVRSKAMQEHPDAPAAKADQLNSLFPTPVAPQTVNSSSTPPSDKVIDDAAARIANRSSTIDQELKNGRWQGATYAQAHDMLVNAITAKDPNWTEQQAVAGSALSKQPATSRYVAAIDNFRGTMQEFQKVVNNLGNTPSPLVNSLKQKLQQQAGDLDQAKADAIRSMGSEEGAAVFQRSGTGSDVSRGWAQDAADITANPAATKARISEILMGLDRSRNATENASYGYIKPAPYDHTDGQGNMVPGTVTISKAKRVIADPNSTDPDKLGAQKVLDMAQK